MLTTLLFRKPRRSAAVYAFTRPRPVTRMVGLDRGLVVLLVLLVVGAFVYMGIDSRRGAGEPVAWPVLAVACALVLGVGGLVVWAAEWSKRRVVRWMDRNSFAWLDERGVGLWIVAVGPRVSYEKIERVDRLPEDAPQWWSSTFGDGGHGVRIVWRRRLLPRGNLYVFLERTQEFIDELERRAASRGVKLRAPRTVGRREWEEGSVADGGRRG